MSYLDQRTSPARIWAIVVVAILHVLIGFAFITGFYQKFTKEGVQDLDVFDVTEEPPPPEEEPPPPDEPVPEVQSPEVVAPPPIIPPRPQQQQQVQTVERQDFAPQTQRADTVGVQQPTPPPTTKSCPGFPGQSFPFASACPAPPVEMKSCPGGARVPVSAQCPAVGPTAGAKIQNPGAITNDDYPAAALRAEAQGTTRITLQVGANGRATGCSVTGSSGNSSLDSTACSLAQRRFRFSPATQNGQPVAGSASTSIRWVLPED
jgi:protein TonB